MLGATSMANLSSGGGDIWTTGAFSFESPLKDLLDTGEYTLEQLLAEDELLQELRGCHQKLISFFHTELAVTKLVQYVISPQTEHIVLPAAKTEEEQGEFINGDSISNDDGDDPINASKPKPPGEWLQLNLEEVKPGNKQKKEPEKDPALKYIRFPYMACEIICCEIPGVIDTLVEGKCAFDDKMTSHPEANEIIPNASQQDMMEVVPKERTSILDYLFSLLHDTAQGELDDYRAGYFDKILTVLFRKRPEEMTTYINTGGAMGRNALMENMLKHLYSHSIMQIAQRLLLPPRPMEQQQQQEGDEIVAGEDDGESEGAVLCDWSSSPEVMDMLLHTLIPRDELSSEKDHLTPLEEEHQLDLSLNASEVLITIIQNSMLSSPIMLSLTSSETVRRVVDAATTVRNDYFSPHESLLTSAMNVLESLILQLGGYGAVGTMTLLTDEEMQQQQQALEAQHQLTETGRPPPTPSPTREEIVVAEIACMEHVTAGSSNDAEHIDDAEVIEDQHLIADLSTLLEHLPRLLDNLSFLLRHPSTKTWKSPTQFSKSEPQLLLGNSRLRIVRVLESLVLLGDPDVDSKLVQSDCLKLCLDFFWQFQWCSMLHQSVANLLVHVFEGQNARYEMQEYFLVRCNLLGRLMDSFEEVNIADSGGVSGLPLSGSETRIADVVENIQDVAVATVSSTESEKGSSGDTPLPVSDDDVEAAMETEESSNLVISEPTTNVELVSTEAVRFESKDVSTVGDVHSHPPAQAFRFGYMGHVIIICQALVHAYSNDQQDLDEAETAAGEREENHHSDGKNLDAVQRQVNSGEESGFGEYVGPKDDFGEPLLLFELVHTHALAERWHDFVDTTLAVETAVQSTPLGGYNMQSSGMDLMHSHRPGLAEDSYLMGDDGDQPPAPPRGMLGGGDVIDMDDNDLEIAASMMASLSVGRTTAISPEGDELEGSDHSGDSNRSYNSGETANERTGYAFDDPLGKSDGLGIELGKLTQYKDISNGERGVSTNARSAYDGDDDGSHSSSDEEPDSDQGNEVPVMDLFAGNFDHGKDSPLEPPAQAADFADFAAFEEVDGDASCGVDGCGEVAENAAAQTKPADDPFSSTPKPNLDDIFGERDHASLLEQYDDADVASTFSVDEPVQTSPEEQNDYDEVTDSCTQEIPPFDSSDKMGAENESRPEALVESVENGEPS